MSAATSSPAPLEPIRDLGIAWMNRGHVLMLRDDEASLEASLNAYNEAVTVLRQLPVAANASWANSLGGALMNRGHLLHRIHGVAQATVALEAFDEAESVLRPHLSAGQPWPRRNLIGTLVNRANLLLGLRHLPAAATAARAALPLATPHEHTAAIDADLALKARRALCDALGQLLIAPDADQNAIATEASDLVDDSLALIRHWADRGERAFGHLALRLFRYGTQLYRLHQPHFLAEFLLENLDPASPGTFANDVEFRSTAEHALADALTELERPRVLMADAPESMRLLQTVRDLRATQRRLAELST